MPNGYEERVTMGLDTVAGGLTFRLRCLNHQLNKEMARVTGLEPATSGVTGRRSNQLSYTRLRQPAHLGDRQDLAV
jgi:hypothetical protein